MVVLRSVIGDWLPPVLRRAARRLGGRTIRFVGGFARWEEACAASPGYSTDQILERVLASTLKVLRGEAAACRDGVVLDRVEHSLPMLAGLLRAVARARGSLTILDYGGALGSSYFEYRGLLAGIPRLSWIVVEQQAMVECGRRNISANGLFFAKDVGEAMSIGSPDAIVLSSVLQYLAEPYEALRELTATGARTLILDRTPFSHDQCDRVLVQHAPRCVGQESYPTWIFSQARLHAALEPDWVAEEQHLCPEGQVSLPGRRSCEYRALVLGRRE